MFLALGVCGGGGQDFSKKLHFWQKWHFSGKFSGNHQNFRRYAPEFNGGVLVSVGGDFGFFRVYGGISPVNTDRLIATDRLIHTKISYIIDSYAYTFVP